MRRDDQLSKNLLVQQFLIRGMHCAGCASRLESALRELPEVAAAEVNFAAATAAVTWTGAEDSSAVFTTAKSAGFEAELSAQDADQRSRALQSAELAAMSKHCAWAAIGFVPLSIATMSAHFWSASPLATHFPGRALLEALLSGAVVFGAGYKILIAAAGAIRRRVADMDFLVGVGAVLAWGGSVVGWLGGEWTHGGGYFEAAAGIITFALLGRWLELRNRVRAGDAVRALAELQPDRARVEAGGEIREVLLPEITEGMIVRVAPGERIPVDGKVLEGRSTVDESWVSGEAMPVLRAPGDEVVAGTCNGDGALRIRVSASGYDAFLQQVLRIVRDAQNSKPPVQRLADLIAGRFTFGVCLVALATAICWAIVSTPDARWHAAFWHGLSVLVVACPCALGLATPVAIMAGTGRGASEGILFRSSAALEALSKVKFVAFDKTGTLTRGKLDVVEWWERRSFEGGLLSMVAAAERDSAHPAGAAVVRAALARSPRKHEISEVEAVPGRGLRAVVDGITLLIGTADLLEESGVALPEATSSERLERSWIAADGAFAGWFRVADELRLESAAVVKALLKRGITPVLLSGDHQDIAERVGAQTGIQRIFAGVRPDGKRLVIAQLQEQGAVAMVGDGVNDAPALTQADVGIAMGGGTAAARQSADVTLLRDDLQLLLAALDLSKATIAIIRQNLVIAFGYNALAIPLAAGVLEAWNGWAPGPMAASAAMALSSISVVLNALRLRRPSSKGEH